MEEELSLEASIELLLDQVPGPVRAFVLNELPSTTAALMQRFNLHVDHAGVLERELLLMLLGQESPEEFVEALTEAGIAEPVVREITTEVNRTVFMRLRAEERTQGAVAPAQKVLSAAPAPIRIEAARPAAREVLPPPNLPGQTPSPAPAPVPPPHIEVPARPLPPPPAATRREAAPTNDQGTRIIHTMARDMQALKGGEDPFRVAHPAPPAWAQAPEMPKPAAPIAPTPAPAPAPSTPLSAPKPEPIAPPAPRANDPLREHLKQYGVDPYREPVE